MEDDEPVVDEHLLAARALAWLFAAGGSLALLWVLLPHDGRANDAGIVLVVVAFAAVSGVTWLAQRRLAVDDLDVLVALSTVLVSAAIYFSGTPTSAFALLYSWAVLHAFHYLPVRHAVAQLLLAVLGYAIVTLARSSDGDVLSRLAARWLLVVGTLLVAAFFLLQLRHRRERAEASLRESSAESATLHRVSLALVQEEEPRRIFALVAEEAASLLGVPYGFVGRVTGAELHLLGFARGTPPAVLLRTPLEGPTPMARAVRSGRPERCDDLRTAGRAAGSLVAAGLASAVAVPVRVAGRTWGVLGAISDERGALRPRAEARLEALAELVGLALSNADARRQLEEQATSDALTGLANHRAFHERLRTEVGRARRYERPLSLALLDLDHFKRLNDTQGHQQGDRVLAAIGKVLVQHARTTELPARVGGEELAMIFPETPAIEAYTAVERIRAAVEALDLGDVGTVTVSAGVCDLTHASDSADLFRLADAALYWAKQQGRNTCFVYSPEVVEELSAEERARRQARGQALAALRALARVIDAKDASTRQHSERVARMAARLAEQAGWPEVRIDRLREAALIHDVGKMGLSDDVLLKPGPLDGAEEELIRQHAAVGADIAAELLSEEQASWIRGHHERWDGEGYPDRLAGAAIPDGARILAISEAWDAMTSGRGYGERIDPAIALEEIQTLAGLQFDPELAPLAAVLVEELAPS
jgi:diguanylate cyclase (GGDEF)-like protein/putative nucleotidyltransferase with HDIG domain